MIKLFRIMQIVFGAISIIGAIVVLVNNGNISAGYAVVPMLLSITFLNLYNREKRKV